MGETDINRERESGRDRRGRARENVQERKSKRGRLKEKRERERENQCLIHQTVWRGPFTLPPCHRVGLTSDVSPYQYVPSIMGCTLDL